LLAAGAAEGDPPALGWGRVILRLSYVQRAKRSMLSGGTEWQRKRLCRGSRAFAAGG